MPLLVRRIKVSDLTLLDAMESENTQGQPALEGWLHTFRNLLDAAIAEEPQGVLVAEFDGHPVGATVARVHEAHRTSGKKHGVIEAMTVAAAWKKQGIAERLLKEAEAYLKSRGCVAVTVRVPESIGDEAAIYRAGNYRVIGWELEKVLG
jgi:ribosomal protein S18 acetylase RimI-like enzyme